MNKPAMLADHLERQADEILAVWRATVERVGDVPEADSLTYAEFVDHVPSLLERIAERLRGRPADTVEDARKHGGLRWRQGYDIAEIVNEYGHLRTALSRATIAYASENGWGVERLEAANEAINEVLFDAIAESVRQFQEDSRAETKAALAEVKKRGNALEDAWYAARLEQMKLQAVLANMPAAVWVADAQGLLTAMNKEAERLAGVRAPDSSSALDLRSFDRARDHGSNGARDEMSLERTLRGETVLQQEVGWGLDREHQVLSVNAAPLLNSQGAVVGAVVVAQDITSHKQLEASLAESEERFRIIVERSPVMIWRTRADGQCDYVNQTYLEFRGRAPEQELGHGWIEGIHPDDRAEYRAAFQEATAGRVAFERTLRILRHDGEYRWIASRGTPFRDAAGRFLGYLGSCLDITPRIELEALLEQRRELAEESSRHKSRLVSALSHDARTPLNAVVLAAQLLEVHLDSETNPEVQECLKTIRHSVRNLLDLLGDLLNLSKIDAGALPTEVSRFPLEPVLTECLASIETQARVKGLSVSIELGNLAGASLETDRSKLKQIVCNLLSNALRYTEKGSIRIVCQRVDAEVRIGVEDTGIGIDPVNQSRIFEEFARLENQRRATGEGTGLGLAICRRLASLLKGEITLQSKPSDGSTFTLVLPLSVLTLTPPPVAAAPEIEPVASGAVLIAEDHADSRRTLAKVLRRMGYRVHEADNGRDALAIARRESLLAVLMDINMPVMDGIEATLAIRADEQLRDLPIFALTGDVTLDNQHRIGEAGVNGYLEKPVTWESLKQALASISPKAGS